jgi:hypothetical protein
MGTATCGKYPGECKDNLCRLPGYMTVDAESYSSWGIDSRASGVLLTYLPLLCTHHLCWWRVWHRAHAVKMDGCNSLHSHATLDPAYEFMGDALNKTGRAILYSCSWPDYSEWRSVHARCAWWAVPRAWLCLSNAQLCYAHHTASMVFRSAQPSGGAGPTLLTMHAATVRTEHGNNTVDFAVTAQYCNMWRMYNDIQDSWDSVVGIVDWVGDNGGNATHPGNGMLAAAGPGHYNDPDMLIIVRTNCIDYGFI